MSGIEKCKFIIPKCYLSLSRSKFIVLKLPTHYRKNIPFFYNKNETEFQKDPYERFDPMVVRQTAIHLADVIWDKYPLQEVLDFAKAYLPKGKMPTILEIGCSTGRWIAELAQAYPESTCWGMDYSYQMLKRARDYWVGGHDIYLDFRAQGFPKTLELKGTRLGNLQFGLAKASELPFLNESQNLILHSFLLDRLDDLKKALIEMYRVLANGGQMIFVTPLNFQKAKDWEQYDPPIKIYQLLIELGFDVLEWKEDLIIWEPLDFRGNSIKWKCIGVVVVKNG